MAEDEEAPAGPQIDVTSISINPAEESAFEDGLGLAIGFNTDTDLVGFCWRVSYVVDTSKRRLIVEAGCTEIADYGVGHNAMTFTADPLDMATVPEAIWKQTNGLLVATLTGPAGEEVCAVNMVVQIRVDENGLLRRFIFNPMD
eukprot:gb/GFBE01068065.1/.p1 GENE.gb/GFBE01068065.1/~~gb/GFBE01068065.1/.p1  ORF type:complete len:144 (+),score=28.62 gb/GFBE01068065.1/:1-432(+)